MRKVLSFLVAVILFCFVSQGLAQESFLIKVSAFTPEEIGILSSSGIKAYAKTADFYLAEATSQNLDYLKSSGISYEILDNEPEYSLYFFVYAKPGENISKYLTQIKEKAIVLEAKGERAIIKGHPRRIEELTSFGLELRLIKKKPLPLKPETELPFVSRGKVLAYDPLIAEIIQKVTTSELAGWDSSLSGEHPVTIGGNPDTLLTRYTFTAKCDRAAQYIKEQFESFGLTARYDTFTIPEVLPYYVMDIVSRPSGDNAWLGCIYSGVWKTTDAGNHWNNISGTSIYELWALSAPAPETLYGVGNYGVVIKSVDRGETWTQLSSPTSQYLRGVYFENGQSGWITGYAGSIYYTNNGGQSWTNQSTGVYNLYEITFVNDSTGWVVGQNGRILKTVNRGTNWSTQTSGTTGIIFGVDFATPNKGWVCGQNGYLRYTTDAGTNWVSQTSGTIQALYMVSAPDSLHSWVAGLGGVVLQTSNAGTNWVFQNPGNPVGSFYEIYFLDTLQGWVTGYSEIVHTTDGGQNWVEQTGNLYPRVNKYNVVAIKPGQTQPGKECLITAHYDDYSENPTNYAPGADDNGSGTAAVLTAAHILKDYVFDYTLKFVGFAGEEQGLLGSQAYAQKAQQRGDTIIGVYNFDMIAWEGNGVNIIELHAGTGASSQALADITIGVINDYTLPLIPQKITSGATDRSDHASFWAYGFPAILGIEDFEEFNPYYHTTNDRISAFDMPYFTDFSKAGIASLAILAQPIPQFKYGDANGDGKVTVSDAVYLINYLFKGGPAPVPLDSGDANCDGQVTVADVVYIINYLFKGGPVPGC
ncbi:MAG: M20/M25/M40 family metallo-hydrolase [candidate division Zixibacteria bacterium]|nr:M20/M25/M40 family metallo-hydrolase [candidate division Zixibacteria bacterium]